MALFANTSARLLHPPDVGSEGKEVVDLEQEAQQVVGLVIQRDQFPDRLFAPAKRDTLLADGVNPVYDKEIRSEIFSQGTLMLRVVIQVSMLLAIPLMAVCLYIWPQYAPWYVAYVVVVQHAGGARVLGGQRHQRTRAPDAGPAADHRDHALADPVGQTVGRPARVERVDAVPALAAAAGVRDGVQLLGQPAGGRRLHADRPAHLPEHGPAGPVLLGGVPQDVHSLMTTYLLIIVLFCAPLATIFFARTFHRRSGRRPFRGSRVGHQSVRGGI